MAMCISLGMVGAPVLQKTDTTYLHLQKQAKRERGILKNFHVSLPAVKTYPLTSSKSSSSSPDDKLLSNVRVYPNPVTDQINLKYFISKNSNVNIKIMDVLGNEVVTLFSQRVDPGEKVFVYNLNNKLNSGFYFVRVVAGTESVIKRISIL